MHGDDRGALVFDPPRRMPGEHRRAGFRPPDLVHAGQGRQFHPAPFRFGRVVVQPGDRMGAAVGRQDRDERPFRHSPGRRGDPEGHQVAEGRTGVTAHLEAVRTADGDQSAAPLLDEGHDVRRPWPDAFIVHAAEYYEVIGEPVPAGSGHGPGMGPAVGPEQDARHIQVGVPFQRAPQETHIGARGAFDIQDPQTGFQHLDREDPAVVPRGDLALQFGNRHFVPVYPFGLGNDVENHRPFFFPPIRRDFPAAQDAALFPQGDRYARISVSTCAHDDFDGHVASGVHHFVHRQMGNGDVPDAQRVADPHRVQGQFERFGDPERIAPGGEVTVGNQDGGGERARAGTAFEKGQGAADIGAGAVGGQGIGAAPGHGRKVFGEPVKMDAVPGIQGIQRVTGKDGGQRFVPAAQTVRQSHARRGVDEDRQAGRFGPFHQHARYGIAEDRQEHGGGRDPQADQYPGGRGRQQGEEPPGKPVYQDTGEEEGDEDPGEGIRLEIQGHAGVPVAGPAIATKRAESVDIPFL